MRMMPVSQAPVRVDCVTRKVARLARLHYVLAAIALAWFVISWCCWDVSNISDFPEGGQGIVVRDSQGIDRIIENPVTLTYLFGLICIYAVVVGTGLLKLRLWAVLWARYTAFVTLVLWVPLVWQVARWNVSGVLPNRSWIPGSLYHVTPAADIWFAATVVLVTYAVTSLLYYLALRDIIVDGVFTVGPFRTKKQAYAVALGSTFLVLLGLVCFRMSDGRMLVHDAASYGWTEAVAVLARVPPGINPRVRDGRTPLHYAAAAGRLDTVHYLLDRGADINALDRHGRSPAVLAGKGRYSFWSGHNHECRKVLVALINRGADLSNANGDVLEGLVGYLPSSLMAIPGPDAIYSREYLDLLLQRGFPINRRKSSGYTLMDYVVQLGTPADIDRLLSLGAQMRPDLAEAARPANLRHLLARGFDVHARDKEGMTALHYVVWGKWLGCEDGWKERAILLVRHGADIDAMDSHGNTPLGLADDDLRPILTGNREGA